MDIFDKRTSQQREDQERKLKAMLAAELKITNAYRKYGKSVAHQVIKEIHTDGDINIDRWVLAGSLGKRTSLGQDHLPDFDIVLFLNQDVGEDEDEPFGDTVEKIADIIERLDENEYQFIRENRYTVQFKHKGRFGEVKFDFVLAFNFITSNTPNATQRASTQLERALKRMKAGDGNSKAYLSSSLAEAVVQFFEDQTSFVINAVKLAKFWNRSRKDLVRGFSGRSFLIELMATRAAQDEEDEEADKATYLSAFERFLEFFAQRRSNVRVFFPLDCNPNHAAYDQYDEVIQDGGIVLDPVNPYNNLLDEVDDDTWKLFHEEAQKSLLGIYRDRSAAISNKTKTPSSPPFRNSLEACFESLKI